MRKVILGASLILCGGIGAALILAAAMSNDWSVNGQLSAIHNISQYGLMPFLLGFVGIAFIGLVLAIVGCMQKKLRY